MNEENNNQPKASQDGKVAPVSSDDKKAIQPSETMMQELQAQQAQPTQQPLEASPVQYPLSVDQAQQSQPPATSNSANIYPDPSSGQVQPGMSASQMGYNQPKSKPNGLNSKKLLVIGLISLAVLIAVFAVLVFMNIITLSEFKTLNYTNSNGTNYKVDFYTKHSSRQLDSGNTQLISKVSKYGKFPLTLSISSGGEISELNRNGIKNCSGPLPKALDVQNNNVNQTIAVCYAPMKDSPVGVYVAGFENNNKAHIITIGQDVSGIDLSSQSGAKESLTKFGIEPYKSDIERIISSIKVE